MTIMDGHCTDTFFSRGLFASSMDSRSRICTSAAGLTRLFKFYPQVFFAVARPAGLPDSDRRGALIGTPARVKVGCSRLRGCAGRSRGEWRRWPPLMGVTASPRR